MEIIIEIRGKSIFFFLTIFLLVYTIFFNFFRGFLKWKQLFIIAKTYFSISFTRLEQMDFLPSGNNIF